MNKLCVVPLLVLAMSCAARAQEDRQPPSTAESIATELTTSAPSDLAGSQSTVVGLSAGLSMSAHASLPTFRKPTADFTFAQPAAKNTASLPASPEPRFVFGGRDDFRWQLGLGISLLKFRSSFFFATGVGTNTSVTYFTNEWFGVEGRITTSFAPTIFLNEHVKYVGYGVGPKIAWRTQKFEPFVHLIVGGAHLVPKIAGESENGFEFQAGGGAGYRFNPRLSVRIVGDWVRTHMYGEWQENAQGALEAVLHF